MSNPLVDTLNKCEIGEVEKHSRNAGIVAMVNALDHVGGARGETMRGVLRKQIMAYRQTESRKINLQYANEKQHHLFYLGGNKFDLGTNSARLDRRDALIRFADAVDTEPSRNVKDFTIHVPGFTIDHAKKIIVERMFVGHENIVWELVDPDKYKWRDISNNITLGKMKYLSDKKTLHKALMLEKQLFPH